MPNSIPTGQHDVAELCYTDGSGERCTLTLSGALPLVVIGRAAESDIALTWDRSVSVLHTILRWMGECWTVEDNGLSRNGTFVNGRRLSGRHRLRDDDRLVVGETSFTYREFGGLGQSETAEAGERPEVSITAAQRRVLTALTQPYRDSQATPTPASNRRIAAELGLSESTVRTHLGELFARLDLAYAPQHRKRFLLAELAFRYGLVPRR